VPLEGGEPVRLAGDLPGEAELFDFQISPDGSTVVYTAGPRGDRSQWRLYAAAIPEPAALGLLSVGAGLALARRRRRCP
jgi:hypothetical protein